MEANEILTMCNKLSYKYKNSQMREDLVQEGVVAVYGILSEEPDAHPAKLYRAAERAMWDHLNFSGLPVSMPITPASRGAMMGSDSYSGQTYSESGEEALRDAVAYTSTEYDDTIMQTEDHAADYEKKEYEAYVSAKLVTTLSGIDLEIIKLRYYHDMSQEEVGELIGMSKQAVSKRETAALERLKHKL